MSHDNLGDRMKRNYEDITRTYLPKRTNTIIRLDGKAFHNYTKGLEKPFDNKFMQDMDETAKFLCKQIQCAKFGFVQSDEISILVCDYDNINTSSWFDSNLQKICSVSASMATAYFNKVRGFKDNKMAFFDSRVFTIPDIYEVPNYFIWRQQDATRNSISSVAQSFYSSKELLRKNINEQQEMIFQKGTNWNDYPAKYKRGRAIVNKNFGEFLDQKHWIIDEDMPILKWEEFFTYIHWNNLK